MVTTKNFLDVNDRNKFTISFEAACLSQNYIFSIAHIKMSDQYVRNFSLGLLTLVGKMIEYVSNTEFQFLMESTIWS